MGNSVNNPPVGVQPDDLEVDFIVRGGFACEGYVYPLALEQNSVISDDGVTVSIYPGGEGSVFANIVGGAGALASDAFGGIFVVAMETKPDLEKVKCKVRGLVKAFVANTANTPAIATGQLLHVVAKPSANPSSLLNALAANSNSSPRKYVAQTLEENATTPSDPIKMWVNFDGWHGFGGGQV